MPENIYRTTNVKLPKGHVRQCMCYSNRREVWGEWLVRASQWEYHDQDSEEENTRLKTDTCSIHIKAL